MIQWQISFGTSERNDVSSISVFGLLSIFIPDTYICFLLLYLLEHPIYKIVLWIHGTIIRLLTKPNLILGI